MSESMPGGELCGFHDEANEGKPVERKRWSKHTRRSPIDITPDREVKPRCAAWNKKVTEQCHNKAKEGSDLCVIHHAMRLEAA